MRATYREGLWSYRSEHPWELVVKNAMSTEPAFAGTSGVPVAAVRAG